MAGYNENSKQRNVPKHVNEMSKDELEELIKQKRDCNATAQKIIETMITAHVDREWFLTNLRNIRLNHFQDVIEERSIVKICGYPLCSEMLKNVSSQHYCISTKSNRVYDTTERKKFCSNLCYRASNYLQDQLLTSPLWYANPEEIIRFKLLPTDSSGIVGKEIVGGKNNGRNSNGLYGQDPLFTSIGQFAVEALNKMSPDTTQNEEKTKSLVTGEQIFPGRGRVKTTETETVAGHSSKLIISNDITNDKEIDAVKGCYNKLTSDDKTDFNSSNPIQNNNRELNVIDSFPSKEEKKPKDSQRKDSCHEKESITDYCKPILNHLINKSQGKMVQSPIDPLLHIEICLHEWCNLETLIFLYGETDVKSRIEAKGTSIQDYNKLIDNSSQNPKLQDRYNKICNRLNLMERDDIIFNERLQGINQLKPLPDYRDIQEDGKKMELKVNAFYQGKTGYVENSVSTDVTPEDSLLETSNLMPLVDNHAQKAQRRKIVIDKLKRITPDLLRSCGTSSHDISSDIRTLVNTFSLEAHNITFKPFEWCLLGLVIIKILTLKDAKLKLEFNSKKSRRYQNTVLSSFQRNEDYIENLVALLVDVDNLL